MAFNPYESWLGVTGGDERPNYYLLLGLKQLESDHTLIERAAKHQLAPSGNTELLEYERP